MKLLNGKLLLVKLVSGVINFSAEAGDNKYWSLTEARDQWTHRRRPRLAPLVVLEFDGIAIVRHLLAASCSACS